MRSPRNDITPTLGFVAAIMLDYKAKVYLFLLMTILRLGVPGVALVLDRLVFV